MPYEAVANKLVMEVLPKIFQGINRLERLYQEEFCLKDHSYP